jgi:hypothetical protein
MGFLREARGGTMPPQLCQMTEAEGHSQPTASRVCERGTIRGVQSRVMFGAPRLRMWDRRDSEKGGPASTRRQR